MNPRMRRLVADYEAVSTGFAGHPGIYAAPVGPYPPERYQVTYRVPSLRLSPDNRPTRTHQTLVDITLPAGYPREKPYAVTYEPVFHPNFGAYVCIADFWSPNQSLVDVIVQIGDMLQYRLYNVRSPLNAVAANWVVDNQHQVPVGNVDVMPTQADVQLLPTGAEAPMPTPEGREDL